MSNVSLTPYSDERHIKDEIALLHLVKSRFTQSKNYRANFDDKFDKCYKYYRSYVEFDPTYWWKSQLFLPYIFSIIESISPDFVQTLIGGDNFFNCHGRGQHKRAAELMEETMYYQINELMPFYEEFLMFIKSILIYGNGILYTGWKKETKTRTVDEWIQDPILGGPIGKIPVKRTEDKHNNPYTQSVFIKNFFPQPYKDSVENMDWCIERCYVDWNFILKLKRQGAEKNGAYKNLDKIKDSHIDNEEANVIQEMNSLIGLSNTTQQDPINKPVLLKKYWNQDINRLVIIANDKVVIRDTQMPFTHGELPYTEGKNYPLDKEFYAISDVDLLIPLQDKCNDFENMTLDNLFQMVHRMYVAQKEKGINPDDVVARPYGIIWSDDINAIKPLEQREIPTQVIGQSEKAYKDMQRTSGAHEYYQGATPERQETKGGIIKLQQAALRRFGYRIKMLQKTALKRCLTQQMKLNQSLLPIDFEIDKRDTNETMIVNPWDISGNIKMTVSGSSNLVGIEERMIQLYSTANKDPYFNQLELRRRLLDVFDMPNGDKLLEGSEYMLAQQQKQMMQRGALAMLGNAQNNPMIRTLMGDMQNG